MDPQTKFWDVSVSVSVCIRSTLQEGKMHGIKLICTDHLECLTRLFDSFSNRLRDEFVGDHLRESAVTG